MNNLSMFLISLLLTSVLSFAAPCILVGGMMLALALLGQVPPLAALSQSGNGQILQFLTQFGNGHPWEGLIVIGLTCSLVGALFDTYAFYRYQNLRG